MKGLWAMTVAVVMGGMGMMDAADVCRGDEAAEEREYLRLDSLLWEDYGRETSELWKRADECPEQADSLMKVAKRIYNHVQERNRQLALRYAATPSGLRRVFMTRLDMDKSRIDSVLAAIPEHMRLSDYGESLRRHVDTRQLEEGDEVYEFEAVDADSVAVDWERLKGRKLLIIYGGLGCMGESGRQELRELYDAASRDELEIVVYWPVTCRNDLALIDREFGMPFSAVSDFMADRSQMKIVYGVQATPTCFFADRSHRIVRKRVGFTKHDYLPFLDAHRRSNDAH